MASEKALNTEIRESYLKAISDFFQNAGEQVLKVNSNEIAMPCVDSAGNEKFVTFTVKVPTGSRDGEVYDGYEMAEGYALKMKQAEEKAKKTAEAKAKKIEKDKKAKAKQAELKAKREGS